SAEAALVTERVLGRGVDGSAGVCVLLPDNVKFRTAARLGENGWGCVLQSLGADADRQRVRGGAVLFVAIYSDGTGGDCRGGGGVVYSCGDHQGSVLHAAAGAVVQRGPAHLADFVGMDAVDAVFDSSSDHSASADVVLLGADFASAAGAAVSILHPAAGDVHPAGGRR